VENDINRYELQQEQTLCSLEHTWGSICKLGIPTKETIFLFSNWQAMPYIQTLHRNKYVTLCNKRSEEANILKISAADGTDFF